MVNDNVLEVGHSRLGWLYDDNPDTELTAVMLRNTGHSIELTIPTSGMASAHRGPYDRWFNQGSSFGDDPDRTKYSYSPPKVLLFKDSYGSVALVGCRAGNWRDSFSAGHGVVFADAAVLGSSDYSANEINGMRASVVAYQKWFGENNVEITRETSQNGRLKSLTLRLAEPRYIVPMQNLGLDFHAMGTWQVDPVPDGYQIHQYIRTGTMVEKACAITEHLRMHDEFLDLVCLAAWRDLAFDEIEVLRTSDPERALSGAPLGEKWCPFLSYRTGGTVHQWDKGEFLFCYHDTDKDLARWFTMRKRYARAIDPVMRILRSGETWSHQSAVLTGIALEQLGLLICREKKGDLNRHGGVSFSKALDWIVKDSDKLFVESVDEWKKRTHNVYMGAKHGDRAEPSHLDVLTAVRENLIVIRSWIAMKLGVDPSIIESNMSSDPANRYFIESRAFGE